MNQLKNNVRAYAAAGSGIVILAAVIRYCFGDYLTIEGDDHSYFHAARKIVETGNLYAGAIDLRDIYAFRWLSTWLSALGWAVGGESVLSLTFFQLITSISLVALTILMARLYLDPMPALLAGLFAALNPMGIHLTMTLSPDPLLALFSASALALLLVRPERTFWAGVVFSLSYWTKEESAKHLLPLVAVIVVSSLQTHSGDWKRCARNVLIFAIPIAASFAVDLLLCWHFFGTPWARINAALENMSMWKRMGMVDPFGRPWSYTFYLRRLLFPFGPFGFIFYPALLGIVFMFRNSVARGERNEKENSQSFLMLWFAIQFAIFILGTRFGQIQERMLQVLIPAVSVFAAYGICRIATSRFVPVSAAVAFAALYVILCKYDLRWQASPRVRDVVDDVLRRNERPIFVSDDVRFHLRMRDPALDTEYFPSISEISGREALAVIRYEKEIPTGMEAHTLYESTPHQNIFTAITSPLRRFRKEYAPYKLVRLTHLGDETYVGEIEAWREKREERLRAPYGWLSLSGLYWLKEGENVVPFVESELRDSIRKVFLKGARVQIEPARNGEVLVNGAKVTEIKSIKIEGEDSNGDEVHVGRFKLNFIQRSKGIAIRVKDPETKFRKDFRGLSWFPVSEAYRVRAKFIPHKQKKTYAIADVLGGSTDTPSPGFVEFEWGGKTLRLTALDSEDSLFFVFADATGAKETYPSGRFLYTDLSKDGDVTVDFNKAYNPPCAFTPYSTCPLPPPENRLPVRIEAGERRPR